MRLVPVLLATCFVSFCLPGDAAQTYRVSNSEGSVAFVLKLDSGLLTYEVRHRGSDGRWATVVEPSPMGFKRDDGSFDSSIRAVSVDPARQLRDRYRLLSGKRSEVSVSYVEQVFSFSNKEGQPFSIIVRVQHDGAAFRYAFAAAPRQRHLIVDESTGFKLPQPGKVWLQPYEKVATWAPSYETEFQNGIPVGTSTPPGDYAGWALPVLAEVAHRWLLVTEAHLDGNSFAVHLQPDSPEGLYRVRLPEADETYGVAPQHAEVEGPWRSPWRAFIVGDSLSTVVESTMVTDLNPPSVFEDTRWIQPGLVAWSWWSDMSSASDYNRLVPWIDLAAEMKWPLATIDLGWHQMRNGTIDDLLTYARRKGVGLVLWYNSGGRHNQVPDAGPMDRLDTPEKAEREMAWLAARGVRGIKVDFFQSDKQYVIRQYIYLLQAAARHQIMVDFHGATMPRGWARTYPNLMTSEGVRGAEQYWDSNFAEKAHTLSTIYPYTRNVVGSMDFTPVVIGGAPHLQWPRTTNAFEFATAVAFESGWQHICASPAALHVQPDFVRDMLSALPAAWDETRHVAGYPGELAVVARRKGAIWYLAALNGRNASQTVKLRLDFLGKGAYQGSLISDGESQKSPRHSTFQALKGDPLSLEMAMRGGALLRLVPKANY